MKGVQNAKHLINFTPLPEIFPPKLNSLPVFQEPYALWLLFAESTWGSICFILRTASARVLVVLNVSVGTRNSLYFHYICQNLNLLQGRNMNP